MPRRSGLYGGWEMPGQLCWPAASGLLDTIQGEETQPRREREGEIKAMSHEVFSPAGIFYYSQRCFFKLQARNDYMMSLQFNIHFHIHIILSHIPYPWKTFFVASAKFCLLDLLSTKTEKRGMRYIRCWMRIFLFCIIIKFFLDTFNIGFISLHRIFILHSFYFNKFSTLNFTILIGCSVLCPLQL